MGTAPSQPRRIVTRLLVFLLVGAVANAAIAAIFALRGRTNWKEISKVHLDERSGRLVKLTLIMEIGRTSIAANASVLTGLPLVLGRVQYLDESLMDEYLPDWSMHSLVVAPEPTRRNAPFVTEIGTGWPLRSFRGTEFKIGSSPASRILEGLIEVPDSIGSSLRRSTAIRTRAPLIPFCPISPGFAINTIFYAAILWLLWTAPGAIRRMRRKQRGLCIHCAYDLRGAPPDSPNCPECGKRTTG